MKKLYKLLLISLLILNGGNAMKAQSYNNDDSKSSSRAITPTYISKIAVAYGDEASTPKNILNNQGFTIIDYDLNKGCGSTSHYIYMGYKTTTNPAEAITGIFFRKGNNPPNYDTFDGVTAYLLGESNETNPGEDKAVDLNVDAGGDYIYTYVTRNTSRAAVLDGLYFDGSSSASGYVTPNVNLNSGTKGGAIYLHYKQFSGKASATFHYLNSSGSRTSSTTSVSVKHHQQAVNNTPSAPTSVTYDGRTWTLLGWREDNNATTAGSTPSYTYMDSKVYRAVYSADVSITYNANGGSNAPSKQTAKQYVNAGSSSIAKSNTSFTIPSTTPTHDATKCNFAGWGTSSSSTTAQYQAGGSISINKNTTLYAVWPEHNGTKTYVNNGSNHTYTWSCCEKSVTEDHIYDNGIDNYCGAHIHKIDGNGYCNLCNGYPAELVNGYYQIKTADNLFWFAEYVNTIDRTASAKLMNDIDLENRPWTPIGTTGESSHNFRGHFDGNGKTITGLNVTVTRNGGGFFGEVRLGTVEDFTIYGEVKLNGKHSYVGGVIGSAPGANSNKPEHNGATIRNITSYVNVTLGEGSHGSNHVAGFIGYANHETLIENCTWYGTLDLDAYRAQDGVGGLVGKANDNSAVTIRNCAAYGTIKTSYKSGSYNSHNSIYIGGIVSNSVASAQTTLENCIWAGTLINNTNLGSNAHISAIGTLNGIKSVSNCYALNNMPYITTNNAHNNTGITITVVTAEQLASGEIAYKLQGTQAIQIWGQNIDNGETKETLPVLGGAKVYCYEFDSNSIYTNNEFELAPNGKCGDNLYWNVTNNTLTIFGTGAMNDYDNSGNKAPWRSLSTAPTSLVLEDGITHIGNYAFRDCSSFKGSLTIPNSVTTIGDYAFAYCSVFRGSLTIPNSVTTIGNSAFRECSGFTGSLTIPNSVTSIGNSAFENCYGFTGSLTIPNSVTSIGEGAFYKCSGFTGDLTIPNSVTNIGNSAFELCSGFTGSLTIPNSVTTIGNYAFAYCSGFTGFLTIPNSVTTIGNYAFYKCSGFTGSLTIGNSVTTIGNDAFYECSGFTGELTIPNSVMSIGNEAFDNCSSFTGSLTIPNSVTSIGERAFYNCSGFTGSLTIPNSVTSIGNYAFYYCSGFTGSLTIPNSVTSIGERAFSGCSGFTSDLTIPNSVTSIGNHAFSGCSGFTGDLTIPNSVTNIGERAFYKCSGFTGSLTIGNSVTTIGNYAFQDCSGFTGNLTIGNSVTTIGNYAFQDCSGFTGDLTIGNSVTIIGNYAFYNCSGFTEVYSLAKTAPTLQIRAFTGTNSNATLYYPASSEQSYNNKGWFNYFSKRIGFNGKCGDNLYWIVNDNTLTIFGTGAMEDYDNIDNKAPWRSLNSAPKSLVLEEGITYIGNYAFQDCSSFTEVYSFAETAPTLGTNTFTGANSNAILYYPASSEQSYDENGWFNYFPQHIGFDGKCGDNLYWNVTNNILTIFGTGAMYDYDNIDNKAPWRSLTTAPTSLVLEEGITHIGNSAFYNCDGFTGSLTIPNSVTNIGNEVFYNCYGFTEVYSLARTAPTLGTDVFANINENATLFYPASSEQSYEEEGWFGYFSKSIGYDNNKKCGDNLYWHVDDENTLTIFGIGAMYDYDYYGINISPWKTLGTAPTSLILKIGITHIGNSAFYNCDGFTGDLTIPNSVTTIGNYAFAYCDGFTGSLTIPNRVTTIGNSAFSGCSGFTGPLTIPNSVTTIGNSAFQDCYGFTGSLTIPNSVTTIGDWAFYYCYGFTGSLTIPNSVTSIGERAFSNCSGFTGSLTIPNSVSTIGEYAFAYCSGFTGSLTIPISVTTIGNSAFYNCDGFTGSLTIPNSVTTIGEYAFAYCSGFTGSLTIPNSVTIIGNSAFYNCDGFTGSLTIPNSVSTIEEYAFSDCSGFTGSLTIPNSVTTIGIYAFYRCSGFTGSLTIPNSVTTIGNYAFQHCSGFTGYLTIPNSVTTIGDYAFQFCSGFTGDLTIPNSITTIGDWAFANCSGFTGSLTIPNSVTTIRDYAFQFCSGFTGDLTIPNSVTTIGDWAFYYCKGFTEVYSFAETAPTLGTDAFKNINENATLFYPISSEYSYDEKGWFNYFLKRIGLNSKCGDNLYWKVIDNTLTIFGTGAMYDYEFNGDNISPWRKLETAPTSLVLEEGISHIGNSAFDSCFDFTGSLTIPNSVTTIGNYAFYNCSGFTGSLTIGNSVTSIGNFAFQGCSGFTGSLTIPNNVTNIGNSAFTMCSGFTGSLTIPNSVTNIGVLAFLNCSGFSNIFFYRDTNPTIGTYAFSGINAKVCAPVIWESFDNIPEDKLVKMATYVGLKTNDEGQKLSTTGWVFPEGMTEVGENDHVAINAPLVLGSQQDYKTTRLQAEDDGSQQPIANSLSVKSFGLCGNENTTNGNIIIEDGGQLYCEIANGEVTVKKEILGYQQSESESESESKWYTIASPLKDAIQITPNSTLLTPNSDYDLYRYDEPSHTWQNAKNSANNGFNTIEPGRGYLYANAENTTLEFTGNINTETVTYNLTAKSDVLKGFHLVGNPFTHDITFAHLNATEDASLVNGYYVLNGEGAWGATLGSNEEDIIKVGQGILVKATAEGTLAIAKTTSQQDYKTTRGQQTTDNGQQSLCISVSNAKYSDRAFVVFDKGVGLDKMNHENENIPLLYIPMEDADYAIAMMDINVNEIPVNFETNVMGEYTISLRQENCEFSELYLLDKKTDEKVNILEQDYTFIATSNENPERFILIKDNGQQTTDNRPWVYVNNGDIVIYNIEGDADIRIFDALGRCVYHGESSNETTRIANGYSSGVYMIQKTDDKGVNVQKIIL